jgi:predicted amidophosphoribosyltransferase
MKRLTKISPALFVVCALCFLLPFLTVHAGGNAADSFSGARVATGYTVSTPQVGEDTQAGKFEADPMAVFALVCILICFLMSFVATQRLAIFPAVGSLIGAGALFAMKYTVSSQVAKQTSGAMQTSFLPGYYVAFAFLILAALWNLYQSMQRRAVAEEDLVPRAAYAETAAYGDTGVEAAPRVVQRVEPLPIQVDAQRREPVRVQDTVACARCGADMPADAGFCTACGHSLGTPILKAEPVQTVEEPTIPVPQPEQVGVSSMKEVSAPAGRDQATVTCSECRAVMPARLNYCTVCGNPMGSGIPTMPKGDWHPVSPERPVSEIADIGPGTEPPTDRATVVEPSSVNRCSQCGATLPEDDVNFCVACGHPAHESASVVATQSVAPMILARVPELPATEPLPELPPADVNDTETKLREGTLGGPERVTVTCASCGATLPEGSRFCNQCGRAVDASTPTVTVAPPIEAIPLRESSVTVPPAMSLPAAEPERSYTILPELPRREAQASILDSAPPIASWETVPPRAKSAGLTGKKPVGAIALAVLMIVLLLAAGAGWYFWGVNTVIVCSPYDSKVFVDGQELSPDTPGRFSVDHLARGPHTLKVQRDGFNDSFMNLDFPLTSATEWINVRLTPLSIPKTGSQGKARNTKQPVSHVR